MLGNLEMSIFHSSPRPGHVVMHLEETECKTPSGCSLITTSYVTLHYTTFDLITLG